MIYGDITSSWAIFYAKKYYVFLFKKSLITRSAAINIKLVLSKEVLDSFTKLVQLLVTAQRFEEMFGKFKDKIIENLKKHTELEKSGFRGENYSSRGNDWKS